MIAETWWQMQMECPQCHKDCELQKALFSADSELSYIFSCPGCKQVVQWKVFSAALAHRALMNDMDAAEKKAKKGIVTPPVTAVARLENHIPTSLTAEDRAWERAMGINPEEEEK